MANDPSDVLVNVLWIPAGLSCDGDSVALTGATQPASRISRWARCPDFPGQFSLAVDRVQSRRRRVSQGVFRSRRGKLDPFVLVIEVRSQRRDQERRLLFGLWQRAGNRSADDVQRLDRPSRAESLGVLAVGTCATYGGIHAMAGIRPARWASSTISVGIGDRRPAFRSSACPAVRLSPTTFGDHPVSALAGRRPRADDSARRSRPAEVAVRRDRSRRLRPRRLLRAGRFCDEYGSPKCIVKLGCWGPVVNCNVPKRGWMGGVGGCPNVGGICIGCTMPGFPDKFMPFMDEPPGAKLSSPSAACTAVDSNAAQIHQGDRQQRAQVAPQRQRAHHRLHQALIERLAIARRGASWPSKICPARRPGAASRLVEMSWDPITRIVGSLGIYTKIDFKRRSPSASDLVDLSRLQHLHERQGPARRALHYLAHLRNLRRQPLPSARSTRRTWRSA